jgi:hypothetical protein
MAQKQTLGQILEARRSVPLIKQLAKAKASFELVKIEKFL